MDEQTLQSPLEELRHSSIERDPENFLKTLIGGLTDSLEDVVGLEEAETFVTLLGNSVAEHWNTEYRETFGCSALSVDQVCAALVDLKARIGGSFKVVEVTGSRIVLKNAHCPFGDTVQGRSSLCQMTSSVFGRIVADNLGYAHVTIPESIAKGSLGCTVIIDLDDASGSDGDEYFKRRMS